MAIFMQNRVKKAEKVFRPKENDFYKSTSLLRHLVQEIQQHYPYKPLYFHILQQLRVNDFCLNLN